MPQVIPTLGGNTCILDSIAPLLLGWSSPFNVCCSHNWANHQNPAVSRLHGARMTLGLASLPPPLCVCICGAFSGPGVAASVEEDVLCALKCRPSTWRAILRLHEASSSPPSCLCLCTVCGHQGPFLSANGDGSCEQMHTH